MASENKSWTELKEKFWKGETSLEEDRQLKKYFQQESILRELDAEEHYFLLLALEEEELLDTQFDEETLGRIHRSAPVTNRNMWFSRIAAVVLLALSIGLFQYFNDKPIPVENVAAEQVSLQNDPELAKAFEQTKQALLMVSEKLNKGQQQTMLLGKFDHAQQHVKYTIEQ